MCPGSDDFVVLDMDAVRDSEWLLWMAILKASRRNESLRDALEQAKMIYYAMESGDVKT